MIPLIMGCKQVVFVGDHQVSRNLIGIIEGSSTFPSI